MFCLIKLKAKVRNTHQKKITLGGDLQGDFYDGFAGFRSN